MSDRRLGQTVFNLALALLNATLIIAALCLFLGWKLMQATNGVVAGVADRVAAFSPVQDELRELAQEIEGLRADLAAARDTTEDGLRQASARLGDRVEALSERAGAAVAKAEALVDAPELLIDRAVAAAGTEARRTLQDLRICSAPPPA